MYLRKCADCGDEANTVEQLGNFSTCKGLKYNKRNLCLECTRVRGRKSYALNKDVRCATRRRSNIKNKHSIKAARHNYYINNSESIKSASQEYRDNNKEKIKESYNSRRSHILEVARNYSKTTKAKALGNARKAKRRATKLNATPKWLTEEHLQKIKDIYKLAAIFTEATGFDWHVDHIHPLQGKNVCGLHVPWNLRVIPAVLNLQKSNKLV